MHLQPHEPDVPAVLSHTRGCRRSAFGSALIAVGLCSVSSCTPGLVRRAQADYPKLGRSVHVEGVDLHYVEAGVGRPVVLLHGAFGGLQDFTATIFAPLASRHRTLAIDRPGHGYSERPKGGSCAPDVQARLIHAALAELGVTRPVLVGFSFGGAVALAYALEFPDDVAGLVIINSTTRDWPSPTSFLYYIPQVPLFGDLFMYTLLMPLGLATAQSSVDNAFAPEPVPKSFAHSPVALSLRPQSFRANAEDLRNLKGFLKHQCTRYAELHTPLVIVAGEEDQVVNSKHHSVFLHEQVPRSELVMIPKCGHQALYAHPDAVIGAIERVWAMMEAAH